jgi:DMSO/TMAO reductase YedYZ heme-binding membrane subunit
MVVLYLMEYLRKILAGETSLHIVVKILISIGIAFLIPLLLLYFTSLAG